jgi:tetratricopeptide (TPR) repeat protein
LRKIAVERAREKREAEADQAQTEKAEAEPESLLSEDERRELARSSNLVRYQPPVTDYLRAQVLTAEKRYAEALAALERVTEAHLVRPGLFLQTADLYLRLGRWRDAQQVYEKALAIDPDNAHAISACVGWHCGEGNSALPRIRLSMHCKGFMTIRWLIFCLGKR